MRLGRHPEFLRVRWGALIGATLAGALSISLAGPLPSAAAAGHPPVAVADSATTLSGQPVTIHPLANDTDAEGDPLSLVSAALDPEFVDVAGISVSGSDVTVTPAATFTGKLTATYVVSDGAGQAQGTITIVVAAPPPANVPPVARDDRASMYAPAELRLDPRGNDSDPDGDPLTVTGIQMTTSGGSAVLSNQVVVIRSQAGYSGPLVIRYTISDGRGGTASGSITVAVLGPAPNHAPIAKRDIVKATAGRTYTFKVKANDRDPDGDGIRVDRVRKLTKTSLYSVKRVGSRIRFQAVDWFSGTVRIRYRLRDSRGARDWGILKVIVRPRPAVASRYSVEAALARVGMPVGPVDGYYDANTRRAVCAWRTVTGGNASRNLPTTREARVIARMKRVPAARATMVQGLNISVTCQAAFWVGSSGKYRRIMPVSTGMPGYRTRLGTFRVFRSFSTWRYSTLYPDARMYKPMQFSGGQAVHGSATDYLVKTYPASHGCVRMLHRDIDALQAGGFGLGSLVRVVGHW